MLTKFYVAEVVPNSGYSTGPLHVIYSDGAHVIQELPPSKKSRRMRSKITCAIKSVLVRCR